jgi:hypothetical protein
LAELKDQMAEFINVVQPDDMRPETAPATAALRQTGRS